MQHSEHLISMLEQIATNLAYQGDTAADQVAAHLKSFWAPSMLGELYAEVDKGGVELSPIATAAVERLRAA